jgi:FemAB-related protein (PEP-CTERM system-associated)
MSSTIDAVQDRPAETAPASSKPISVRLLDKQNYARWDAFVAACPDATFFHRAGWQTIIERVYAHKTWFYYAECDGQIVGVLPLAEIKSRLFGHSLGSLPFCVLGGVAATDERAKPLLDAAADKIARELNVGHLEYRNLVPSHAGDPAWYQKELYVTFRKEISSDDETNLNAIPRKQRAMVRKGIKLGLSAELDEDVERFFTCYSTSVHRLGTPVFPKSYFKVIKEVFKDETEIRIIVQNGQLIAGVMSFYWRDEVLPYYGGGMPAAREVAGNDFMYWNLMQAAAAKGVKIFDFGRSKLGTGAFDFKKNWGFSPTPLAYEYKLYASTELPDNNPLNPKYQLFIKMWKKLPIGLANVLGPHIVKNLG